MALNTGWISLRELEITRRIALVVACWSRASVKKCWRSAYEGADWVVPARCWRGVPQSPQNFWCGRFWRSHRRHCIPPSKSGSRAGEKSQLSIEKQIAGSLAHQTRETISGGILNINSGSPPPASPTAQTPPHTDTPRRVAIPGGLRGISGQGAVGAVQIDEVGEVDDQATQSLAYFGSAYLGGSGNRTKGPTGVLSAGMYCGACWPAGPRCFR